jgi:anti-anti-sigma regulatory factor
MAMAMSALLSEQHFAIAPNLNEGDGRRFGNSVLDALERGMNHVIIDCREWHRLDLTLLSALVRCANAFARHGATLEFANLSPEMRAIVRELRLQSRLRVLD